MNQSGQYVPPLWSIGPFILLLLTIALGPLINALERFWASNRNKLLVSLVLSGLAAAYYLFLHPAMVLQQGGQRVELSAGWGVLQHVLSEAILGEFIPFIVLLAGLYTISGGIRLTGDLKARPIVNTAFLGAGAVLANFIGTTGAAMLLIRPLLQTNAERKHVRHTVIFFIFLVCNIGGCLLPIGDPPLFLGYLQGVPFLWTLTLFKHWALCSVILLIVYYIWDCREHARETPRDVVLDETRVQPLRLSGKINLLYLLGVVLAVGVLIPGRAIAGSSFHVFEGLREAAVIALAAASMITTPRGIRQANQFTFAAISEVAALFIGIFITMQAPIEILRIKGGSLGLSEPWQMFWASGCLSSVLDNAPTYMVFLSTAGALDGGTPGAMPLVDGQFIDPNLLAAISLGCVFMGANTYIGNGPNFMVRTIAQERGVKMPSFFGYIFYSACILLPLFLLLTAISKLIGWR